jgi:hypothetical protein
MYMTDGPGSWWIWNGSSWSSSSQPTSCGYTTSQSGTTIPSASQITDSSGVVWTVSGGYSYENGSGDGGANITLLLWYNSQIYANTTYYGWYEHTPSSGWFSVSGDPRGSITPNGVSPPSGYHWTPMFDDEFTNDSSLDITKWNAGASNTDWCDENAGSEPAATYFFNEDPSNPCGATPGGLSFGSNGLTMTSNGSPSAAIQTGGTTPASAKFVQEFGYFEARFEEPNMSDGGGSAHSDFWMHSVPMLGNAFAPEFDVGERPTWLGSGNNDTKISFNIADGPFGSSNGTSGYFGDCCGDDLSQNFHTYGLYWANDGSGPYGSVQIYLDGTPLLSSPYTLNSADTNLANGIYILLSLDNSSSSSSDPFIIQYVRVWRLDSN